jgi:DNA-binding CsgD family transcriptional regulator/tetratricopeptide (TPR) repeat protein
MESALLERDAALDVLTGAIRDAGRVRDAGATGAEGHGSVVLISGEAGIGKTSLVRAFVTSVPDGVRVLAGACDDLLTPRALGPLRDAAAAADGPLRAALATGAVDEVFTASVQELAGPTTTVLLIEDLHWADAATLDVLGYLIRRVAELPAVLVLTYRTDTVPDGHPLARLLGSMAGIPAHRLPLTALTPDAVRRLARGSGWDAEVLHEVTAGNPFYVTETLAAPDAGVPATVADAVLARLARLDDRCRTAVQQLSVVPGVVGFALADALLGDRVPALAEAEMRGMIQVRGTGLAFRHELARRAVEQSLPWLTRRELHRAVVAALACDEAPDLARLVHHAVRAADDEAVARFAPRAAREAAAAGSHREALAHFEVALRHARRLEPAELAHVVDDHAWELHNARRFTEAVAGSERAVALYRELGDEVAVGEAQVRLSRHRFMAGDAAGAQEAAEQALAVLEPTGRTASIAYAATYHAAVLALSDPSLRGDEALTRAERLATQAGRVDLVALCLNYRSQTGTDLDADGRIALMRRSLDLALKHGFHEIAARGYTNLGEMLFRYTRLAELDACLTAGRAFARERGFWSHAYNLDVHACLLALRRGDWTAAEQGLKEIIDREPEPGMLGVYSLPPYGRLLARRGSARAKDLLDDAWRQALDQGMLLGLSYAGAALAEWAWLNDRPDVATDVVRGWDEHLARPGADAAWAEVARYARRAGVAAAAVPAVDGAGLPEPWASGVRGDWQAAAAAWERVGDPYERALELAESGQADPTTQALRDLEDLGADAAAVVVRRRLRDLGIHRVPRRRNASTRANPAGLTQRQVDVLDLLVDGLTNAEIAERLVLSVRTVDTHVAAILAKLEVRTRREAVAAARSWRTHS